MRVLIETYRNWEINFDTDKEVFCSLSDAYDTQKENSSYAAAKKAIDDFIKDNTKFIPFFVTRRNYSGVTTKIKIIGVRKDGRFYCEGKDNKKEQISEYDEKDYFIEKPDFIRYANAVDEIDSKIDALRTEKNVVSSKITGQTLKDVKPNYIV